MSWASSSLPSGLTSEINAASAVSANDVWAITEVGGDILHWNGSQWSVAYHVSGSGKMFTDINALSSTDVWVFGFSAVGPGLGTWHYNGQTWTHVTGSAAMLTTASAVSAANIWATGDTPSGVPAIRHYDGTTWRPVTAAPALGYSSILALSSTNVWATGTDTSRTTWLAHFSGGKWTKVALPRTGLGPGSFAPDARGGFWLGAYGGSGQTWVLHYTATGQWSQTAFTAGVGPLALIPGTTSVLAVGSTNTTSGANATIWAHGTI